MKDFYYILGTDRNCTPGELNDAYRKLAQKLQPVGQEYDPFLDSHFQEITEAYQILSSPVSRRKYDVAIKKNYQRRLYYFKIRHLNVLALLALFVFTGLFGFYVIKAISGTKTVKPAKVQAVVAAPVKHHKRKHSVKTAALVNAKPKLAMAADIPAPVLIKLAPVKPASLKSTPVKPAQQAPAPYVPAPPRVASTTQLPATYTTELKANLTGVVTLHESADYRSAVLASIPNHSQVAVLEKGASFYKISFGNQTGYVPKWTIGTP
jgi:cytoskeletal protein RodZ